MPKLFVVTDQRDLAALATSVLAARTRGTTRDVALDAIRRANPTLDLDRLRPGMVVVIPRVPGTRPAVDDPVDETAADLVGRLREGMESLARGAEAGEEARRAEKKEAQELFGSAMVKRLAADMPEIGENIESVRAAFKQDDVEAKRALGDLRSAIDGWAADLEVLRELL